MTEIDISSKEDTGSQQVYAKEILSISNCQEKANQNLKGIASHPLNNLLRKRHETIGASENVGKGRFLYVIGRIINTFGQYVSVQILQWKTEMLYNPSEGREITESKIPAPNVY